MYFPILHRMAALSGCIKNYSQSTTLNSTLYWDHIIFCTINASMFCEFRYTVRTGIIMHVSCPQTSWILVFCSVFVSGGSLYTPRRTTAAITVAFHKSSKSQVQIFYSYKSYRPSKIATNLPSTFLSRMNTPVTLHALEQEYSTMTLIDQVF